MFNYKNYNQISESEISEEEINNIDQQINTHQGILFLLYVFGLIFFVYGAKLIDNKIKFGHSWVKLFGDYPFLQYIFLYFI